jgi:flavin reductase (DIM6/NTAB) family NADH-FMN oxidoreductase RutF
VEEDKNGKIKVTFEVEINQAVMELIKENTGNMVNMVSQSMEAMRSRGGGQKNKPGEGSPVTGIMQHGQE